MAPRPLLPLALLLAFSAAAAAAPRSRALAQAAAAPATTAASTATAPSSSRSSGSPSSSSSSLKLPPAVDAHFKFLRAYLHPSYPDPHLDLWRESAAVCQSEGAAACAEATVFMLDALEAGGSGAKKSRYRELPRSKAAWVDYYTAIFTACPKAAAAAAAAAGGKPSSGSGSGAAAAVVAPAAATEAAPPSPAAVALKRCESDAAAKLIAAGSGNTVLKLDEAKPIGVSWAVFFDLNACLLAQLPGKCGGIACGELIGWSAKDCYE